jgi:hypothetical protein
LQLTPQQDAEKARHRKKTVSWFIWFVSFVWLNETYQMNQINQINKTNRSTRRAMLDEDGLFEHPALRVYHLDSWRRVPTDGRILQTEHGVKGEG